MGKQQRKILIIDDDPEMIQLLEKFLKPANYITVTALNGTAGLEKAKEEQPDLVLLDIMLPDIGGPDLVKKFQEDPKTQDIPVIFITVTMGVELDKGNETMEIDGCLYRVFAKPIHNKKLLSEIRKSINRRIHGNKFYIKGS